MAVDLSIKGGKIASPAGVVDADLYVQDGKVLAMGRIEGLSAKETIDAGGLIVMPGAVDGHVHMMDPGHTEREDFTTGTQAAAVGGATTVIVSKCGWTPYDGMSVKGKVVRTILRGKTVAENGKPVGRPGYGRFITRPEIQRREAA
jgi:dihydroorotase-like cyclic amidohydrolase